MNKSLTIFLAVLASGMLTAQDVSAPFQLTEFSIGLGSIGDNQAQFDIADAKLLAPNSIVLEKDFSEYDYNKYGYGYDPGFTMSILTGFSKPQKTNALGLTKTLRVGINYEHRNNLAFGYSKTESFVIDTLTSSQTGEMTFVDSTSYHNLSVSNDGESVGLDVSYILGSNQANKWSFSAGLGLISRVSFNNYTNIHHSTYNPNIDFYEDSSFGNNEDEVFFNKTGSSFTGYIPLLLNFRISKEKLFWDQCSLTLEMRPSITVRTLPEIDTYANSEFPVLLGIKYNVFSVNY